MASIAPFGPIPSPFPRREAWVRNLVVACFAVLALVYGLSVAYDRYIEHIRATEARVELGNIASAAAQVYERDGRMCPSATAPVPREIAPFFGKYQSSRADWLRDQEQHAGFACLGYEKVSMQYFQYSYASTLTSFTATARGIIKKDGSLSDLVARGEVIDGKVVVRLSDPVPVRY